jgi:hypothetical protein
MDFKTTIMKKIFTILLVLFTLLSNAQTLEYNRTIDTLLSITIPSGTVFNSTNFQIFGSFLTPPNNKTWKVQSIIINTPCDECQNGASTLHYSNASGYVGSWGNLTSISGAISVMLRNNSNDLGLFKRNINSTMNHEQGTNYINSPLWLSQSQLGIAFTHIYGTQTNTPFSVIDYTGYVHLSILEFNVE